MNLPKSIRSILPIPDLSQDITAIRKLWNTMKKVPQGNLLYSKLVGKMIPYTGSINPVVVEMAPGLAVIKMSDRRALRNHIQSVHAIALANLAEYAGNSAVAFSMAPGSRFIVSAMSMQYLKKARGTIIAEGVCPNEIPAVKQEYKVLVELRDESGDSVARAELTTLVGPSKKSV